jgi:hypothetical protein
MCSCGHGVTTGHPAAWGIRLKSRESCGSAAAAAADLRRRR